MIASSNTSRAKLEWSMFGIYAIIKGVEGNVQDATLRHCATTAFLANMYAQVESEIGATQADSTELAVVTTERFREYDAAWHKFGDDRGAQELGEQVSKRVLEIGLRDNPLVLAFGQAAVINMIETARFIQKTLSIVKLEDLNAAALETGLASASGPNRRKPLDGCFLAQKFCRAQAQGSDESFAITTLPSGSNSVLVSYQTRQAFSCTSGLPLAQPNARANSGMLAIVLFTRYLGNE